MNEHCNDVVWWNLHVMYNVAPCHNIILSNHLHVPLTFIAKCLVTGEQSNSIIILYCTGSRYLAISTAKLKKLFLVRT